MNKYINIYFSWLKLLLPRQPDKFYVGLDIGQDSCRLIEASLDPLSVKIRKCEVASFNKNDKESAIKSLLDSSKVDRSRVFTAISGQGTLIRFISMPKMPLEQLKESLLIEADKYFPFSKDQIYMDCHVLSSDKSSKSKIDVLVAVAKRDLVRQRLELLTSLGLQTNFIGVNAIALSNVFIKMQGCIDDCLKKESSSLKGAVAILDIGESKSSLIIFSQNVPRFTRDISLGGKDVTQKISNAFGVSFEEAEKLKIDPPQPQASEVQTSCQSVLLNLISEIKLSFDYFSSENNGQDVRSLYLTGSSSRIFNIEEFFSKELDLVAQLWDPTPGLEFYDNACQEEFKKQFYQFGVSLGLSIYGYHQY
jgi:type IV pilus assembly protein PilM